MSAITIRHHLHVELHYDVLAHVDLGRDAASLFDRRRTEHDDPPWIRSVEEILRGAPDRLRLQILPLVSGDLDEHLALLARSASGARLAAALQARRPAVGAACAAGAARTSAALEDFLQRWGPSLTRARAALWGARPAPPLEIRHAAALGRRAGSTHGRATSVAGRRVVAVAVTGPLPEQVFCQILHEETHAVTDAAVRAAFGPTPRDTRAGSAGHALHRALERESVAVGGRIVQAHLPDLIAAYRRWQQSWGVLSDDRSERRASGRCRA